MYSVFPHTTKVRPSQEILKTNRWFNAGTPFNSEKTASTHQKHPAPKVAVSYFLSWDISELLKIKVVNISKKEIRIIAILKVNSSAF